MRDPRRTTMKIYKRLMYATYFLMALVIAAPVTLLLGWEGLSRTLFQVILPVLCLYMGAQFGRLQDRIDRDDE